MKYNVIPIKTGYIKANEGYDKLVTEIIKYCLDEDYIIISETPLSTAENNLVDESEYEAGILAYILTEFWGKYIWGYLLGPLLGLKKRTIHNLRVMPKESRQHKQFILEKYGLKYALQPTSEAGVDLSNVPEQYVSLLPENPEKTAKIIQKLIMKRSGKNVNIIIIDSDATYSFYKWKFTNLPTAINEIKSGCGIYGYILSAFSKNIGPTILASTTELELDTLIEMGRIAEKCQKDNDTQFFETVYDMKKNFNTTYSNITQDMLKETVHIPAVIIRQK